MIAEFIFICDMYQKIMRETQMKFSMLILFNPLVSL